MRKKVLLAQFRPGIFLQIKEKDEPDRPGILVPLVGDNGIVTLGRGSGCEVLIEYPLISRKHAALSWAGGKYVVRDLGSDIGTFVGDRRLIDPQELGIDGKFTIGSMEFVIRQNPPITIPLRTNSSAK